MFSERNWKCFCYISLFNKNLIPSSLSLFFNPYLILLGLLGKGSDCHFSFVGHLTARSDVYSFGVVLLEMLTGRRVVDKNRPHGEHNLIEWAKPFLTSKRKVLRIMDHRIEGQYSVEAALKAALLAVKCLALEPKFRPKMPEVVKALEQLQNLNESGSLKRETTQRKHQIDEASRRKTTSYPRPAAMNAE